MHRLHVLKYLYIVCSFKLIMIILLFKLLPFGIWADDSFKYMLSVMLVANVTLGT